ncbi:hypothetical protein [Halanaerobium sp. ST460_2HS_T2]|jgi:hypothetical protein|uniref:hypothetical protein n=1 Tax=Halanaerobium sp. ST460_2HS_T2 TaxID=2183914 RepID=UPI000DF49116|nr:hypothetical protein [Halanaerobium sp. ST460_2HS_T2]RCW60878.1 hypothetical protein DFR80_10636 [Halanaerobium sp. ST460_2HS_T2]
MNFFRQIGDNMQMVLNELSLDFPATDIENGKKLFKDFMLVYLEAINSGISRSIILETGFDNTVLAPGYPVAKWRNDHDIDRELKRVYIRMNDRAEFFSEYLNVSDLLSEFYYNDRSSKGLLIAVELDFLAISFLSDELWNTSKIQGEYRKLIESGEDTEVNCKETCVYNVSSVEHVDHNSDWINEILAKAKTNLDDSKELWKKRNEFFSELVFCESVKKQISGFRVTSPEFKQIIKKLDLLNDYFVTWDGEFFEREKIPNVDPESQETLNRYEEQHTFSPPDNEPLLFSWHIRFTGSSKAGRIYFYPHAETGKCIVGHIGSKLPTVTNPNP